MSDIGEIKRTLKKWELMFYRKHNRKPSKNDIDDAPHEIRDVYKNYARLKKVQTTPPVQRDSTSSQNDTEHDHDSSVLSKSANQQPREDTPTNQPIENDITLTNQKPDDISTRYENNDLVLASAGKVKGGDEVWGANLNKTAETKPAAEMGIKKSAKSSGFLDKLGSKLFNNSMKISSAKKTKQTGPSWKKESTTPDSAFVAHSVESFEPHEPFQDMGHYLKQSCTTDKVDEVDGSSTKSFTDTVKNIKFVSKPANKSNKNTKCDDNSDIIDLPNNLLLTSRKKFSVSKFLPKEVVNPFLEEEENFTSDRNISNKNVYEKQPVSSVEVVDESMFEQEFQMFETPKKCATSKKLNKPQKYGLRNNSFVEKQATEESVVLTPTKDKRICRSSEKEERKLSNEIQQESTNRHDAENLIEGSCEESPVKKKSVSRKRKQKMETSTRKRAKVNDGTACPTSAGDDGIETDHQSSKVQTKYKPMARRPSAAKNTSGNFVRLNMKVKKYRRKDGCHLTGGQWKRQQWKQKMQSRSKSYGDKCFICNETGHWSRDCPKKNRQRRVVEDVNESDFPSIQEASQIARGIKTTSNTAGPQPVPAANLSKDLEMDEDFPGEDPPESFEDPHPLHPPADPLLDLEMGIIRTRREHIVPRSPVEPMLSLHDGKLAETSEVPEIREGLKIFGFSEFKPGQEVTIKRIMTGLSTLVVLSTGGGKSLCYQMPAYLYAQRSRCITIVVSPLVSLMEDQVTGLPPGVRGACLHSNMTQSQRNGVMAAVNDGNVHFLLVSPEAVVGGRGGGMGSFPSPDKIPPIPFVCIDEAHCLSEWSHNFRPSYLRLCKILREKYGVTCFLGLTATATKATALDVSKHLGIDDVEKATIRGPPIPRNLVLSVSRDDNRDEALIHLLQGERFQDCHSIIIYCTRRELTTRVASLIRTCLKDNCPKPAEEPKSKVKSRSKKKVEMAETYHAGLTPAQRKRVQNNFMCGRLRIVVATVAFGMGLDKSDVRAVIHYNMPKSFEGYVQEIGRAGRDGNTSHCHLFLDPEVSHSWNIGEIYSPDLKPDPDLHSIPQTWNQTQTCILFTGPGHNSRQSDWLK